LRRCLEKAEQLADGVVAVLSVTKRQLFVDDVAVAAPVADLRQVASLDEVVDDLRGSALGYAHGAGDVSEAARRIACDRFQDVRVVRQEPPPRVVVGSDLQPIARSPSLREGLFLERLQKHAEHLRDRHRRQRRRPHFPLAVDSIAVSTAHARLRQVARLSQLADDLRCGSLCDPDGLRDVAQAGVRVSGDAGENVAVVGDQAPTRRAIS